jgi:hypothetical protein
MNPAEIVASAAAAVRSTKYRTQGVVNGQRRDLPPTLADRRYAAASAAVVLRELAAITRAQGPLPGYVLDRMANDVERQESPR